MTYAYLYDKQIAQLDRFFDTVKSEGLASLAPKTIPALRCRILAAVNDLLVWGRPYLAAHRGIDWLYQECGLIAPHLEKMYSQDADTEVAKQALFFLAFLPVPNQWRWLSKAIATLAEEPEIAQFLTSERLTIEQKLIGKGRSKFALRHFTQILKAPRLPVEKGVLRIFSLPYLFLRKQMLQKIADSYVLFVEPPMGIVFRHAWWRTFTELPEPCIFGLGGEEDRNFVARQANTNVINLAHGDFLLDAESMEPASVKDFDIIFNATFDDMERKRHIFMLQLLKDRRLSTKKALFIGRGAPQNVSAFRTEVDRRGLTDRVVAVSNVPRREIPRYFTRCRTGVHLSLYENSCRCIYEFFRADLPCVVAAATAGIRQDIFNAQTGAIAGDEQLPEIIAATIDRHDTFTPRQWLLQNLGSLRASTLLNEYLISFFADHGYLWQSDIVPLDSSGADRYLHKDHYHQFLPQFRELLSWMQPSVPAGITLEVDEL